MKTEIDPDSLFNPQRMEIARMRRMIGRRELALKIGVKPQKMMRWVHGLSVPKPEQVDAIAAALDWPKRFFFGEDLPVPDNFPF